MRYGRGKRSQGCKRNDIREMMKKERGKRVIKGIL